jgi:chaperonin GroEL (HSP60 family)
MDKLLVDDNGMGIVTNNGASILREMVEHPIGDIIADLSVSHEDGVRDGTTTTAVLTGQLLWEADSLIEQDVHPTTIARGYRRATERACEVLEENAVEIDPSDTAQLAGVAETAMAGKGTLTEDAVQSLVVDAVQRAATDDGAVDLDAIRIEKVRGAPADESVLSDGVIINKERSDASAPYRVEDARIVVFNKNIELRELVPDSIVDVSTPDDVTRIVENQRAELVEAVDRLEELGVNAVIGGEDIAEELRALMVERGMYVARRAADEEINHLVRATGANPLAELENVDEDDLGRAGAVEETDLGGDRRTLVEDPVEENTATFVLYGWTRDVVDELKRTVDDALTVVAEVVRDGTVLPGGGATETALALDLRDYATEFDTREQLAIEAFADALEVVPRTLAENAGINPIDGVVDVRAAQSSGNPTAGIDGETGEVVDALEAGIVEPHSVKERSVVTAREAAEVILRLDGLLPKRNATMDDLDEEDMPGQAGRGGGGGMGGM